MSRVSKKIQFAITFTLIVLAFLCSINATISYFTASTRQTGQLNFPNMQVRFVALDENDALYDEDQMNDYTEENVYKIELYPIGGSISRGQTVQLSLAANSTTPIGSLAIMNMEESTSAYVRFWIDAYEVLDNQGTLGTTNYGKYFILNVNSQYVARFSDEDCSTENPDCYYLINAINPYDEFNNTFNIGNQLTLSDLANDPVPADVLGKELKITLSLQAVQTANEAFLSEFKKDGDVRGYYRDWI